MAVTNPVRINTVAGKIAAASASKTPPEFKAMAGSRIRPRTGRKPRKIGSHLALNPQTKGTKHPQASSTRSR